jgi:allantoicase
MADADPEFTWLPDLASRPLGGAVIWANDETFAEKENLVTRAPATFRPATFGHKGQIYDGWETRRRREPGHDEAIVRLGIPGVVRGVVVDTAFFTGNYPPQISVEAIHVDGYPRAETLAADPGWTTIVERAGVLGDTRNPFPVTSERRWTHVRLSIYPDGGVARFRVHGEARPDLAFTGIDLAALENGGMVLDCSNRFYSSPANLISPGRASVMGDGWETARRRTDGNEWVHLRLAGRGVIRMAELDTSYFIGNSPGAARLSGRTDDGEWVELLSRTELLPDTRHRFALGVDPVVSEARLDIYPDGGMARLRLHGELA